MQELEQSRLEMSSNLWNQLIRAKAQGDSTGIQMSRFSIAFTLSDGSSEKLNVFNCA